MTENLIYKRYQTPLKSTYSGVMLKLADKLSCLEMRDGRAVTVVFMVTLMMLATVVLKERGRPMMVGYSYLWSISIIPIRTLVIISLRVWVLFV